jgi:hypothetical protein
MRKRGKRKERRKKGRKAKTSERTKRAKSGRGEGLRTGPPRGKQRLSSFSPFSLFKALAEVVASAVSKKKKKKSKKEQARKSKQEQMPSDVMTLESSIVGNRGLTGLAKFLGSQNAELTPARSQLTPSSLFTHLSSKPRNKRGFFFFSLFI